MSQPIFSRLERNRVIQIFDHHCRIARRNGIGGNIFDHNRSRTNHGIIADRHPFSNDDAVPQPHIIADDHFFGMAHRHTAVIEIMPVGIGNADILSRHTTLAQGNGCCGHDPGTRTNQTVIPDFNFTPAHPYRPDGESYFSVGSRNDCGVVSQGHGATENFHVPRFHKYQTFAEVFKLRSKIIPRIPSLKSGIKAF